VGVVVMTRRSPDGRNVGRRILPTSIGRKKDCNFFTSLSSPGNARRGPCREHRMPSLPRSCSSRGQWYSGRGGAAMPCHAFFVPSFEEYGTHRR
jgi:hypothetical protein